MKWTPQKEELLRRLYATTKARDIAAIVGISERAVYVKAHHLGLNKEQPCKIRLDIHQRDWLVRNFPHVANELCASILGISMRSVVRFARSMGLAKTSQFMRESQANAAAKAQASHVANQTYPPKGVVNANFAKGAPFRFKGGERRQPRSAR